MHFIRSSLAAVFFLVVFSDAFSQEVSEIQDVAKVSPPKTLVADGAAMAKLRLKLTSTSSDALGSSPSQALKQLLKEADQCLERGPWTVVSKKLTPPSGDKHDYMSVGPYWWPDPKKDDGLPYIRRDGEVNPERSNYDNVGLARTANNSLTLALAWYFTGDSEYARHAADLLRNWFLSPETRMNPNLNFGQAIPGRTEGRGIGIIDTVCLIRVVDAALILESSSSWNHDDASELRQWFDRYLEWLQKSPHGIAESKTKNNHATWYDAQVACFAIYAGKPDVARRVLGTSAIRRIASQIRSDGSMPHELARTKSWNYATMNLRGFFTLAALAEHVDVDLWNYQAESGGSIQGALDFLVPFATGQSKWGHQQISKFDGGKLATLLHDASREYGTANYENVIAKLGPRSDLATDRIQLTRPTEQR